MIAPIKDARAMRRKNANMTTLSRESPRIKAFF
jgi:hypothetical protein